MKKQRNKYALKGKDTGFSGSVGTGFPQAFLWVWGGVW